MKAVKCISVVLAAALLTAFAGCQRQQPKVKKTEEPSVTEAVTEAATEAIKPEIKEEYKRLLKDMIVSPEEYIEDYQDGYSGKNEFAVSDINGDGQEELIVHFVTTCDAEKCTCVWEYDNDTGSAAQTYKFMPNVSFYSTGYIHATAANFGWSNGEVWPFFIQKLMPDGKVKNVGYFRDLRKEMCGDSYEFPAEDDFDDDGVIYYRAFEDTDEQYSISEKEFNAAIETYIPEDKHIEFEYQSITEENIDKI